MPTITQEFKCEICDDEHTTQSDLDIHVNVCNDRLELTNKNDHNEAVIKMLTDRLKKLQETNTSLTQQVTTLQAQVSELSVYKFTQCNQSLDTLADNIIENCTSNMNNVTNTYNIRILNYTHNEYGQNCEHCEDD
ncbi:MAG: hypothetical protein Faunusvirus44_10 [Faunusvirus sp.]|jgi:hypothetical protein|uniref:Uncharacterized protein n=1 Tax=Faunusvirus sp. TaxID=2487766 RepID=A0A3G4ZY02_9VIRU|nr:MAG: hypothetical protein Faunusvirus44_10 [Faunusvirus sp.]